MKYLISIFIFLCVSLIVLGLFVGVPKTNGIPNIHTITPHMYDNAAISVENIHITVLYFVPKDSESVVVSSWKEDTTKHIKNLLEFHALQFQNTSKITYEFLPTYTLAEKNKIAYEGSLEVAEDYDALIPIKEEISKRLLSKDGDLYAYNNTTKNNKDGVRNVYLVVFEGRGAAGNGDFALVSRSYLTNKEYSAIGSTFLSHEFYHTLGVPDNYKSSIVEREDKSQSRTSLITKKDIMGQVNIPLSSTYIDMETLRNMGM